MVYALHGRHVLPTVRTLLQGKPPKSPDRNTQHSAHLPLHSPVERRRNRPELPFRERIAASFDGRQEQDFLLQVRREVQQIHDLRQPSASNMADPRQLRLVRHQAVAD